MPRKNNQYTQLIRHFTDYGSISAMEAHTIYRIRSLSSRISNLAKLGVVFRKTVKVDPVGQRYVRYKALAIPVTVSEKYYE